MKGCVKINKKSKRHIQGFGYTKHFYNTTTQTSENGNGFSDRFGEWAKSIGHTQDTQGVFKGLYERHRGQN